MNTKKILLILWFAGIAMVLSAQWTNRDTRLIDEDEFLRPVFRVKPTPVRGAPLLLPEKSLFYAYTMDAPAHEITYFYDENNTLKTIVEKSLKPNDYFTVTHEYNRTLMIDDIDMPDTVVYYTNSEMTRPYRRIYWNWKLYDITPTDSFYFEKITQMWNEPQKRWENDMKFYSGFVDTVLWEENRYIEYTANDDGWTVARGYRDPLLYDDNGFVVGKISFSCYKNGDVMRSKTLFDLNEDGSIYGGTTYLYDADGQPYLFSISKYEWLEWNGYGGMNSTGVEDGDGLFALYPWMKLRNKQTLQSWYVMNHEGEKISSSKRKKNWNIGPFDSHIDSSFQSFPDNPDSLYLLYLENHFYDTYGNYIEYNSISYTLPDETGHQKMISAWITQYYYHHNDYGEYGVGCDTMMRWKSQWLPTDTFEMQLLSAEIITQYVGFTGLDEIHTSSNPLSIAPNPVSGVVTIAAATEIKQLQIFDITGKLMKEQVGSADKAVFDTGNLPKGIYIVQALLKNGERQMGKLVVR